MTKLKPVRRSTAILIIQVLDPQRADAVVGLRARRHEARSLGRRARLVLGLMESVRNGLP